MPGRPSAEDGDWSAAADIERYGVDLAEHLLDKIDSISGGLGHPWLCTADVAAHQLLWQRYMATGEPRCGGAVIRSLRAICGSALVDEGRGGIYRLDTNESPRLCIEKDLCDNAQILELLTWVWRVERCPALRRCAEGIVTWAVEEMRIPGLGFAASTDTDARNGRVADALMIVALVEAGSVFERRDWLALAREVFDEVVANCEETGEPRCNSADDVRVAIDDGSTMSRAAIRLFEAFGKRRDLARAEEWAATLDAKLRDIPPEHAIDPSLSLDDALTIGVLARLHALTGAPRYAERADHFVQALRPAITSSGNAAVTTIANVRTAAQLVLIRVSGDPKLPETRELMRIALDCGLPDRLVLGPGAGGMLGERPLAHIGVGACSLAPIDDAARLRVMLAPGGLAAFLDPNAPEAVDSRRMGGIP